MRDILVNTHAHAPQVRAFLDEIGSRNGGLRLREAHEPVLLGSAGTITANRDFADGADDIFIIYADNFSLIDLRAVLHAHRAQQAEFTMLLFRAENPRACGIAGLDDEGRIVSFEEKPAHPESDLANAGLYVLDANTYREVADMRAFDIGFEVIPRFVGRMWGYRHTGYHRDIGTPESHARAEADAPALLARSGQLPNGERRAVFLDRDGTLIEHVHYLNDPNDVRLVADCGDALRRLADAGFSLVVVTNQAAIAKGLLDEAGLARIHERLADLLAAEEVGVEAIYFCPLAGDGDRSVVMHPDRKPGPGMLQRGARELGLSLPRSYMVGDMQSDVLAGRNAGCRANLLVEHAAGLAGREPAHGDDVIRVGTLAEAADWILADSHP